MPVAELRPPRGAAAGRGLRRDRRVPPVDVLDVEVAHELVELLLGELFAGLLGSDQAALRPRLRCLEGSMSTGAPAIAVA